MPEGMTFVERAARQTEITARLDELNTEFAGRSFSAEADTEWTALHAEFEEHNTAIRSHNARVEQSRALTAVQLTAANAEGVAVRDAADTAKRTGQFDAPNVIVRNENIYDLDEVRISARSLSDATKMYRDRALRAIEGGEFSGAPDKAAAQERAEYLLKRVDDDSSTLAKRMLITGSPEYTEAFGRAAMGGTSAILSQEHQRALALGVDASGGYAVPFQLDPTVILTSDGVINPLRSVARQVQITGKVWEGVTSAGISVTRYAESAEAVDAGVVLAQPSVGTSRVQGFVPFSVEIEQSWDALSSEITMLLRDAKDTEEAQSFTNGNGTGNNPGGLFATLATASDVAASTPGAITVPTDVNALMAALAPRFRPNASFLAETTTFNAINEAAVGLTSLSADMWATLQNGNGTQLRGKAARELSTAPVIPTAAGTARVLMYGDYRTGFIIVDRIGMSVELVPHLFGAHGFPTGQRGIYAYWNNGSKVLVPEALRALTVTKAGS